MVRIFYSDVSRSSELTAEKAQSQNSETWDSSLFHRNGRLSHLRIVLSSPSKPVTHAFDHIMNQLIFAATTIIMKRYHLTYHHHHYKQHRERAMEHHQTTQRRDRVAGSHASSLRKSRTHISGPQTADWSS